MSLHYRAAAIQLWYQDGNEGKYGAAFGTTREFYLDRAIAVVDAAIGDKALYRHDREAEGSHIHPACFVQVYPELVEVCIHPFDGINGPCVICGKKGFKDDS